MLFLCLVIKMLVNGVGITYLITIGYCLVIAT
jgi:hypothetical protein